MIQCIMSYAATSSADDTRRKGGGGSGEWTLQLVELDGYRRLGEIISVSDLYEI